MTASTAGKARSSRDFGTVRPLASGRFQARYRVDGQSQVTLGTYPTEKAAHDALAGVRHHRAKGQLVTPTGITFAAFAETWLELRKIQQSTRDLYRHQLTRHLIPALGSKALRNISPETVKDFYLSLGHIPTAQAKAYRLLKTIMASAENDGLIGRSPCRITGGGAEPKPARGLPTPTEVRDIIAEVTKIDRRWRALAIVAFSCGLRASELRGLRRSDVDVDAAVLYVRRSVVRTSVGLVTKSPKSEAGVRALPLAADTVGELVAHLNEFTASPASKADALTELAQDPPVFTHESWRPVTRSSVAALAASRRDEARTKATGRPLNLSKRVALLAEAEVLEAVTCYADLPAKHRETGLLDLSRFHQRVWHPALLAAGVDPAQIHLHDARGFVATSYTSAGASLKETMDLLGHSSPQAALRYQRSASLDRHRTLSEGMATATRIF